MSAIEVDSLAKNYGSLHAVDGISFNVKEGEIFSLLGPNGAGKTTTIEILEGLRERDGGDVSVLGSDPWKSGYKLHRKLGVIPQEFSFFPYTTPREAVAYYATLFGVKVDVNAIIKKVLLEDSAKVNFLRLSGGQKRKFGLALALVNDPQLLFLDEPTTGLDPQARRAVWEVIRELKKEGRTVMLTTHYLDEAETLADRVAIMHHGKIITSGTPTEIIDKHSSMEQLQVRGDQKLVDYLKENTKLKVDYDGKGLISILLEHKDDAFLALGSIEQSGLEWSDLATHRDSLEDIFVRMVGEQPEEH